MKYTSTPCSRSRQLKESTIRAAANPYFTSFFSLLFMTCLCCIPGSQAAFAQWSANAAVNTAVSTASRFQIYPAIIPDGSGGYIITWNDNRNGNNDIYAQRINAAGVVQWGANGVAICTETHGQFSPVIVSDGSGGAIISWYDDRGSDYDIYAQRINANGVTQWAVNGLDVCTAPGDQLSVKIVSDGSGGAIILCLDTRSGNYDIYAQRINANGTVQWAPGGAAVCTAAKDQVSPVIISDGSGGAIITWYDNRGAAADIYAQRINAAGGAQWTTNGVPVCIATSNQFDPTIVSDGAGGAIITWTDTRSAKNDVYAQRISGAGAVQWTVNGVGVSTGTGNHVVPTIVTDGSGGAIITWYDDRNGIDHDIYAQRINAAGVVQWTINGVVVCAVTNEQINPTIISDGSAGAIITWIDGRNGNNTDIYAQRINANGAAQWAANGVAICTNASDQSSPNPIVSDGSGGAIIAWYDLRNEINNDQNYDIFVQNVNAGGTLGNNAPAICQSPPTMAYSSNTQTGNQPHEGELGMEFLVNAPDGIIINQIGAFDDGGNGISGFQPGPGGGVRVAIFNRSTQTIVPGLDVTIIGVGDVYVGNHQMKNITPVTLPPGDYEIVAKGYYAGERNGNAGLGGGPYPVDNGGGAITFGNEYAYGKNDHHGFNYPVFTGIGDPHEFLAGTFNFTAVIPCGGPTNCEAPPAQAYTSNTVSGNQSYTGELGMEFIVNNPSGIIVKQLGAFDDGANGITGLQPGGGVRVAIFNRSTHNIVPGLNVNIVGFADAYTGNHRMKNIPPVTLPPGDYVVVAKGYYSGEKNGNVFEGAGPFPPGNTGGGAITFGNETSYGPADPNGFSYPGSTINSADTHVFLAGTFSFTKVIPCGGQADLSNLVLSQGILTPTFAAGTTSYTASVANSVTSITVTPTAAEAGSAITVNGAPVTSGTPSGPISLSEGSNIITTIVTAQDGTTTKTYTVNVTRAAPGGCESAQVQAYIANTQTGNQSHRGELGMEFLVNNPGGIIIKQLGAFDDGGNGIVGLPGGPIGGVRVAIFNKSTHTIVPGLNVTISGLADAFTGNHRMKNIPFVTLPPGDYVIVAKGYHAGEHNGNINNLPPGGSYPAGDNGGGAITFVNGALFGPDDPNGFSYPPLSANPDNTPVFLAGTFDFTVNTCPPGTTINMVTSTTNSVKQQDKGLDPVLIDKAMDIKVYPNPTNGRFSVQLPGTSASKLIIQVMNSNGRLLEQKTISSATKTASFIIPFNLTDQPPGIYLVKVEGSDGIRTEKFVIER